MQRLSTTNAVMPKGRIINSCTVDHRTLFYADYGNSGKQAYISVLIAQISLLRANKHKIIKQLIP
jgi:hypothetical protein